MRDNKRHGRASLVVLLAALCTVVLSAPESVVAAEPKTGKERLSDKGSDEQRVDNCGVPVERRGSKPRPDCRKAPADEAADSARNVPGKAPRAR